MNLHKVLHVLHSVQGRYGKDHQRQIVQAWLSEPTCWCVEHLTSVEEGTASTEAAMKMAIADDIIGDTAAAFMNAHGL